MIRVKPRRRILPALKWFLANPSGYQIRTHFESGGSSGFCRAFIVFALGSLYCPVGHWRLQKLWACSPKSEQADSLHFSFELIVFRNQTAKVREIPNVSDLLYIDDIAGSFSH